MCSDHQRGLHNIEDQLMFASNPTFIFHDSRGFEAGSAEELEIIKNFISTRAAADSLKERLHAIWYGEHSKSYLTLSTYPLASLTPNTA